MREQSASDYELLDELHQLRDDFNRIPTKALVAGNGTYPVELYEQQFGSWDEALEAAGFEPGESSYPPVREVVDGIALHRIQNYLDSGDKNEFFKGQLLLELRRLAYDLDRSPSLPDLNQYGKYSSSAYQYHFDSWNDALEEAGLEITPHPQKVPKDDLLSDLQRLADELNKKPEIKDIIKHGEYSHSTYYNHFDSIEEARVEAGVQNIPKCDP